MNIPVLLRELGCEPGAVFAAAGLDPARFEDPDAEIPFVAGSRLLERCVEATGCGHFGFLLGTRAHASSLGVAGFVLRFAPNLGVALRDLAKNLDLHDRGGVLTLETRGGDTLLGYAVVQSGAVAVDQIHDMSIAVACNILRDLCGPGWNPQEVLLSRRQPGDTQPYERFFRAPLRFDAARNALRFPASWLDHELAGADPLLYRHFVSEAKALHSRQTGNIVGDLRRVLRRSLSSGKFSAGRVAGQLCIHERTLHRRLRESGTTYRHELEDIRFTLARQMLAESVIPQSGIADALGYASVTTFGRAFRRWSGETPTRWRVRQRRSARAAHGRYGRSG